MCFTFLLFQAKTRDLLSNVARELAEENEDLLAYSSTEKALQRRLARARVAKKKFPKLPTSVDEVEASFPVDLTRTCAGRPFLRVHGAVSFLGGAAWLFVSDEGLRLHSPAAFGWSMGHSRLRQCLLRRSLSFTQLQQVHIIDMNASMLDLCNFSYFSLYIYYCRWTHLPCRLGVADQEDCGRLPGWLLCPPQVTVIGFYASGNI